MQGQSRPLVSTGAEGCSSLSTELLLALRNSYLLAGNMGLVLTQGCGSALPSLQGHGEELSPSPLPGGRPPGFPDGRYRCSRGLLWDAWGSGASPQEESGPHTRSLRSSPSCAQFTFPLQGLGSALRAYEILSGDYFLPARTTAVWLCKIYGQ